MTRHNYIQLAQPTTDNVTITNACAVQFNAAAGTHLAVDAATTKTTPTNVDGGWIKVNINDVVAYVPVYLSKTS